MSVKDFSLSNAPSLRMTRQRDIQFSVKTVGPHKYGCLMALLPISLGTEIDRWSKENIPTIHLGGGGRETDFHITIKYGFTQHDPGVLNDLRSLIMSQPPIAIKLGKLSLFQGNEDGDVLKMDVESPAIHELNKMVTESFPCVDTHPNYLPHVTIAYLNPSFSEMYTLLDPPFAGWEGELDRIEWGGSDSHREFFTLQSGNPSCPLCGSLPLSNGDSLFCGNSPCEWSQPVAVFVKSFLSYPIKANKPTNPQVAQGGFCQQGERSDLTGCTPHNQQSEANRGSPEASTASFPTTEPELYKEADGKARGAVARFKQKMDEITDVPVLRQMKKIGGWLSRQTIGRIYGKLEERYGTKTAVACMAAAQITSWSAAAVGTAIGTTIWLPSAVAILPAWAAADCYHRVRGTIKTKDMETLDFDFIHEEGKRIAAQIVDLLKEYLQENEQELSTMKPSGEKALSAMNELNGGALVGSKLKKTKQVGPSPFKHRKSLFHYQTKEFVRKVDKRGRNYCLNNGKRVSCGLDKTNGKKPAAKPPKVKPSPVKKPPKEKVPKEKPQRVTAADVHSKIEDMKKNGITEEKVKGILDSLSKMTVKDLQEIRKLVGGKGHPLKADLIKHIKDVILGNFKPPKVEPEVEITPPPEPKKTPEPEKKPEPPPVPANEKLPEIDLQQKNPDDPMAKAIREDKESHRIVQEMTKYKDKMIAAGYVDTESLKKEEDGLWNKLQLLEESLGKDHENTNRARSEWNAVYRKNKAIHARNSQITEEARAKLQELMKPKRPPNIGLKFQSEGEKIEMFSKPGEFIRLKDAFNPTEQEEKIVNKGVDFIKSITEGADLRFGNASLKMYRSPSGRACFSDRAKETVEIVKTDSDNKFLRLLGIKDKKKIVHRTIDPEIQVGGMTNENDSVSTMVHELGHFIDNVKPGVFEKSLEFQKYRLGDEPLVDMGTIPGGEEMKGEMVRKDDFDKAFPKIRAYYIGKEYKLPNGKAFGTEIISMGIEALYTDPVNFITKDAEYAQFIIGILRM